MMNVQGDPQRERLAVEKLIQQRVDAILFTTPVSEANVRLALEAEIPVVQVERPTSIVTDTVVVDNYGGAVEAVKHLISLGHERIAFVGGDPAVPTSDKFFRRRIEEERLAGYLDTLRTHHISIDESLITLCQYYSLNESEDSVYGKDRSIKPLLRRDDRPTAVFVSSDMLAAWVLQDLYAYSLKIPQDVSVIGFDDTLALYLAPPLTTVQQPMFQIGKAAVHLALKHFQKSETFTPGTFQQVQLATQLVIRSSTGPVS